MKYKLALLVLLTVYLSEVCFGQKNIFLKEEIKIKSDLENPDLENNGRSFSSAWDVCVDSEGNILILDFISKKIFKYSPGGKLIFSVGKSGKGPDEFLFPMYMNVDKDNNIYVYDSSNRKFIIFAPDGRFIKSIKFKFNVRNFAIDNKGDFYIHYFEHNYRKKTCVAKLEIFSNKLVKKKKLYSSKINSHDYSKNNGVIEIREKYFGEKLCWGIMGDRIFVGESYKNWIKILDKEGNLIDQIKLDLNTTNTTAKDIRNFYSDDFQLDGQYYDDILLNDALQDSYTSKEKPKYKNIFFVNNKLLIKTYNYSGNKFLFKEIDLKTKKGKDFYIDNSCLFKRNIITKNYIYEDSKGHFNDEPYVKRFKVIGGF